MSSLFTVAMSVCGVSLLAAFYWLRKAKRAVALEEAERVLREEWDACDAGRQVSSENGTNRE